MFISFLFSFHLFSSSFSFLSCRFCLCVFVNVLAFFIAFAKKLYLRHRKSAKKVTPAKPRKGTQHLRIVSTTSNHRGGLHKRFSQYCITIADSFRRTYGSLIPDFQNMTNIKLPIIRGRSVQTEHLK